MKISSYLQEGVSSR